MTWWLWTLIGIYVVGFVFFFWMELIVGPVTPALALSSRNNSNRGAMNTMTWYIAITNPNCHRRAENGLAAIGYQVFWPRLRKWVSHARTKKAKEYPILGRYVFVEIPDGEFYSVRNVNGVEGLLTGDNGAPAKIPPEIVYRFRDRYMRGEWDFVMNETGEFIDETGKLVTRQNRVPAGALVRIMEGEFADLMTIVRGRQNGKIKFLPPGKQQFYFTREENVRAA